MWSLKSDRKLNLFKSIMKKIQQIYRIISYVQNATWCSLPAPRGILIRIGSPYASTAFSFSFQALFGGELNGTSGMVKNVSRELLFASGIAVILSKVPPWNRFNSFIQKFVVPDEVGDLFFTTVGLSLRCCANQHQESKVDRA